jgi:hypothetical protein
MVNGMPNKVTDPGLLDILNSGLEPERINERVRLYNEYAAELKTPEYSPVSDSNMENFFAGLGQGGVDTVKNIGNMAQLDKLGADWFSDESINRARERDEALLDTKAGLLGSVAGSTAVLAPVGGVAAGAAKSALRGSGGLSKAVQMLAGKPGRRALTEGAVGGAIIAGPENRGVGAVAGATGSGLLRGGGQLLKKSLTGPVKMSGAGHRMARETGDFVPIAYGASEKGFSGAVKNIYRDLLSNIWGVGGNMRAQQIGLQNKFNKRLMSHGIPEWARPDFDFDVAPQAAAEQLNKFWGKGGKAYEFIRDKTVNASKNRMGKLFGTLIKQGDDEVAEDLGRLYAKSRKGKGYVDVEDLLEYKRFYSSKSKDLFLNSGNDPDILAKSNLYQQAAQNIDELIAKTFRDSSDDAFQNIWKKYQGNIDPYKGYLDIIETVGSMSKKAGKFMPSDVAGKSAGRVGTKKAAEGGGYLQKYANEAGKVIDRPPEKANVFKTLAAMATAGILGAAANPLIPAAAFGLARGAGTKGAQKFLTGQYGGQRALSKGLRRYAPITREVGRVGRRAGVQAAMKDAQ